MIATSVNIKNMNFTKLRTKISILNKMTNQPMTVWSIDIGQSVISVQRYTFGLCSTQG